MKTVEHKVDKNNKLQILLADDEAALDEVVISGYATTTRAKSSVNSLTVEAEVMADDSQVPNANFTQTLSGQVPGLEVSKNKNAPGKNKSIQIRKNLQETAFFFPQLQTDKDGNVSFNFKAPEALTKWKLQLLAHTKTLKFCSAI